ncbi:MAG: glycosyltransferase [Proteobacteria bacterium]|nr:glycosyltransferase [Pseudomonadota bacterium]
MDHYSLTDLNEIFAKECDLDGFLGRLLDPFSRTQLDRLGRLFAMNYPSQQSGEARATIPKVIHQIWIGPKPLPEPYKKFMTGWRQHYPDWEHRLWTDAEVKRLDYNTRDIVDASSCYGQKTDIIRAEILFQQGGLYIDTDYESIKPLSEIHDYFDFYGTLRAIPLLYLASPTTYPSPLLACNSMIGSRPGHPILAAYLDKVRDISRHPSYFDLRIAERLTLARVKFSKEQVQRIKETTIKTYIPYHHAVLDQIQSSQDRNIMFPPTYFNPIDTWHSYRFIFWRYWMRRAEYWSKHQKGPIRTYQRPLPDTFAIHHSKASWAGL